MQKYINGFKVSKKSWYYGEERVEVVNMYKYLGLFFTTKLFLSHAVEDVAAKAKLRSCHPFTCPWKIGDIPRNFFFSMFDSLVVLILMVRKSGFLKV